jgi:hypothetical protein|tara:strand:+ start:72 stop:383 length:312 start_codon:yes stop_codon:yes gene_type:complete
MPKTLFAFTLLTLCSALMIPTASAWGFGKSPTWSGRIYADKISDMYQHIGEFKSLGACKKAVGKATKKRKNLNAEKYVCAFNCTGNTQNAIRDICKDVIRVFP